MCIHSLMYTYFAVRAAGIRVPKYIAIAITTAQILQMVYGIAITMVMYWLTKESGVSFELKLMFYTYWSYKILFLNFFYQQYFKKREPPSGKQSQNGNKRRPPQDARKIKDL